MELQQAAERHIDGWMSLAEQVAPIFPGLNSPEALSEHRRIILRNMTDGEALCVTEDDRLLGALLFSRRRNEISFLAVDSAFRRRGAAAMLLRAALQRLDRTRAVTVTTFCEEDSHGTPARALYLAFGFQPGEVQTVLDHQCQQFLLPPERDTQKPCKTGDIIL